MPSQQPIEAPAPVPFLKWPGGKRWLVAQHPEWFPAVGGRHIEAFLGGGAAFFHCRPRSAVLSDKNSRLIETYETIKNEYTAVGKVLAEHHRKHSFDYYYEMRERRCRTDVTRAAQFIYLNRTCFNGIYRVNLKGVFNVPIGTKTNVVMPTDDFKAVADILSGAELTTSSFEETVGLAQEGDFLYLDPPYTVRHNTNNFLKYNEQIFSWKDQLKLAKQALAAASRGVRVLVSNANHEFVRSLYRDPVWTRLKVWRHSILASSPDGRKLTTELAVSNFLERDGTICDPRS